MSIEWNGEGLPPVGTECEMQHGKGKWVPVDIISHYDGFVFGWNCDLHMVFFSDKAEEFRPIHTEAERKRELACRAMTDRIDMDNYLAGLIYDDIAAGKIPGVKLEAL